MTGEVGNFTLNGPNVSPTAATDPAKTPIGGGTDRLLQHLVSINNESGAAVPAPGTLLNLEGQVKKVPVALLTPGMSGLVSSGNMVSGLLQFISALGSTDGFGNIAQLIQQAASAATGSNGSSPTTQQIVASAASILPANQLVATMGNFNALATSLVGIG